MITTAENFEARVVTIERQNELFDVTIRDNDRVNLKYPCGHKPAAVFVNTGHGVEHAIWTMVDDFEKHTFRKGKVRCQRCASKVTDRVKEERKELTARQALELLSEALLVSVKESFARTTSRGSN